MWRQFIHFICVLLSLKISVIGPTRISWYNFSELIAYRHKILFLCRLRLELHVEVSDSLSTTRFCVLRRSLVLVPNMPVKTSASRSDIEVINLTPSRDCSSRLPSTREHDDRMLLLFLIRTMWILLLNYWNLDVNVMMLCTYSVWTIPFTSKLVCFFNFSVLVVVRSCWECLHH